MPFQTQIPTDNLYKFIAISGLIILGVSFFCQYNYTTRYNYEYQKLHGEYAMLEAEVQLLDKESCSLEEKVDSFNAKKIKLSKEEKKLNKETFKSANHDLKEKLKKIALKQTELAVKGANLEFLVSQYQNDKKLFYLGIFDGLIFIAFGFFLWYFRLQIYLDKIVKLQSEGRNKK